MENKFPCAGVIVIDQELKKTVLVTSKKGHYSFPKGKREPGETSLENALRETEEETGISPDQYDLVPNFTIQELSRKGNKSVCYYLATLKPGVKIKKFTYDEDELTSVQWYDFAQVPKIDLLKDERKEVFAKAQLKLATSK